MRKRYVLLRFFCLRCGHRWAPRTENVKICPKCKSASWDTTKDGALKPSGFKVHGKRAWWRMSDSYSEAQRQVLREKMDAFIRWMDRVEGD